MRDKEVKPHPHIIPGGKLDNLQKAAHFFQNGDPEKAWMYGNKVLCDDPESPQALYILAQCALGWDLTGLAYQLFRRSVALRPDQPQAWQGFGATLLDLRQFDEAEMCFKRVLEMLPDDSLALGNLATLELNRGNPEKAIQWADKAIPVATEDAIKSTRGFAYLMLGDWAKGFPDYRYSVLGKGRKRRVYRQPEEPDWEGAKGQTVVVQCEQGLGDEIRSASLIPNLIRDSKTVIMDSHPRLAPLFQRSFPDAKVYGTRKELVVPWIAEYEIDATVQLSQLGEWYRKSDADFPRKPYLVPCPEKRAKWRKWLDQYAGQKVGLSWTGGIFLTNRKRRSVALGELGPLMHDGATYFSLQYVPDEKEVEEWNAKNPRQQVIRPPIDQEDYDDTLAFLAELDHVMSVTTTVIHACGAIGKRCWVLVPSIITSSQWQYGLHRSDMVWYPEDSVRLYRQLRSEADMTGAIARMAKDWRDILRGRKAA